MDVYDNGIPKYSTAQDIYDALCELVQTEEMNILSEIGVDVSWENQTYYYTNKGNTLKEKFEELSEYGEKMWLINLAIFQMGYNENYMTHDIVYEALFNPDMAKRIGFKKLFIEKMLSGDGKNYEKITEDFIAELDKLNRFDHYEMIKIFNKIASENSRSLYGFTPYPTFSYCLKDKIQNLKLLNEIKLITECKAHLTAYDDFIFGLRVNQALHERQEQSYQIKVAQLRAAYDEKLKHLLMVADRVGLLPALNAELQPLPFLEKGVGKHGY